MAGMPLVDGPHMACLGRPDVRQANVQEKASMIEALTAIIGQEIEMANKYKIYSNGREIFYAVEQTDCLTRQFKQCAPDCAPWSVEILYTEGGAQMKAFHMKRDCTCTCCCFNRPVVEMIDIPSGRKIGSISDPFACCDLTFSLRDERDETALKAKGGCCQWGLCCPLPCGPCSEVNFPVEDAGSGKQVGHLKKKVPNCCKFFLAPDVDNFDVDFRDVVNPQYKALLIGLAIFMDFRYFSENPNDDDGGLLGAAGDMMGGDE